MKVTPVQSLKAIELLERGAVQRIHIYSYIAGQLSDKVAGEVAALVEERLTDSIPDSSVKILKTVKREREADAVGTGSGVL